MNILDKSPTSFKQQEGAGLLANYGQEEDAVADTLMKRRQKLAETKLHLAPDAEDTDNG